MKIIHHLFIGGVTAITYVALTKDYVAATIIFISSTIIDIDHIPSYWFYTKKYLLSYREIKNWCFFVGYKTKWFSALHNIWTLIVLVILWRYVNPLWFAALVGVVLHYFFDIVYDAYYYYIKKRNIRPYRRWIF